MVTTTPKPRSAGVRPSHAPHDFDAHRRGRLPEQPIEAPPPPGPSSRPSIRLGKIIEAAKRDFRQPREDAVAQYRAAAAPWNVAYKSAAANPNLRTGANAGVQFVRAIPGETMGGIGYLTSGITGAVNVFGAPIARRMTSESRPDYAQVQADVRTLRAAGVSEKQIVRYLARIGVKPAELQAFHDATLRSQKTPGVVRAVSHGFSVNLADELDAASAAVETSINNGLHGFGLSGGSAYSPRQAYEAVMQAEANASHSFAQKYPVTDFVAGGVGALANPINKPGSGFVGRAKTLKDGAFRSGVVGSAIGAIYGAGEGRGWSGRVKHAQSGAVSGALIGSGAPLIARGIRVFGGRTWNALISGVGARQFSSQANMANVAKAKIWNLAARTLNALSSGADRLRNAGRLDSSFRAPSELNASSLKHNPPIKVAVVEPAKAHKPNGAFYSVAYEMVLDQMHWGRSRRFHDRQANESLDNMLQLDPGWAAHMESLIPGLQKAVAKSGGRRQPNGWTWHHNVREGTMQLVPKHQHSSALFGEAFHPSGKGGYSIWALPAGAPKERRRR